MNVHVLQHVPFEGPGSIAQWVTARGAALTCTRCFAGDPWPDLDQVDCLVIMGGPMSVNDENRLPWLAPEKAIIRLAIDRGIPTLGVCLGAQLIASALGARVYPNRVREIGWFPVHASDDAGMGVRLPAECLVFHWHGETFDLPDGAVRLATSPGCVNQAFQAHDHVVGLQFHLEMTPDGAAALLEACAGDLVPGPYVQSAAEIAAAPADRYRASNAVMDDLLTSLVCPRRLAI